MNRPSDLPPDHVSHVVQGISGIALALIVGAAAWNLWPTAFPIAVGIVLLLTALAGAGYLVTAAVLMVCGEIDLWLKDRRLERRFRNSHHSRSNP